MAMNQVREIVDKLKEVNKKDSASLSIVVNGLTDNQRKDFLQTLSSIERQSESKIEKAKEEKRRVSNKAEEEARFLGRLKARLSELSNNSEQVFVKTSFTTAREFLLVDTISPETSLVDLRKRFVELSNFIADLDTLKCLAHYRQGKILQHVMEKEDWTIALAAKKLRISINFAERLTSFTKMANRFPGLLTTGYSFETLLKYKRFLEQQAEEDENFRSLLELNPEIILDEGQVDEDEEELLSAME